MSLELAVTEWSLTLVPQPLDDGGGTVVLSPSDLGEIMREPIAADDGEMIISARDQISLVLKPPILWLTDHSGTHPMRSELVLAATAVNELFVSHGFVVQTYRWDMEGSVIGIEPREVMGKLVREQRIAHALGADVWSPVQVTIASTSSEAGLEGELNISLQDRTESDRTSELAFNANVHYHHPPDFHRIGENGAEVWAMTNDVISRLVG